MINFFLHREAYVGMLSIDIVEKCDGVDSDGDGVLSGINKTYRPHTDDRMKPQDLDIALTRSFHGDP